MSVDIEEKVKKIFLTVFSIKNEDVSSLTRENFEKWDSMAQVSLIISIEEEFNLILDYETQEELNSFKYIVAFIKSKYEK